jgi:GT2 family glycosyltransferase
MQIRKSERFCIGVILFHPSTDEIDSLLALCRSHDVYAFANSDLDNDSRERLEKETVYLQHPQKNCGISQALNVLFRKSIADGFDYFLCLDQDSIVGDFCSNRLLDEISSLDVEHGGDRIIGFCLNFNSGNGEFKTFFITSGTIFRLKYLSEVGFYNEQYFVDLADYELSLRSCVANLKFLNLKNNTFFDHTSGQADTYHRLFGMRLKSRRYGLDRIKQSIFGYVRLSYYCLQTRHLNLLCKVFRSFMIFFLYRMISLFPIIDHDK